MKLQDWGRSLFIKTADKEQDVAISQAIEDKIKVDMTMPQFIEELKQSGIETYVKYTRTNKIKGISYSIGNEIIQGKELGKKYSWGGLQKYL